jgi:2-octaprenyl-6-methoxyphenol hydroxylase
MTALVTSEQQIRDILIIGAGPVGTTLAILCARAGFDAVLIDAHPASDPRPPDGRTFAIVRGSWRLLGQTGVHGALAPAITPLWGLEAVDGGTHIFGAPQASFSAADLGGDATEPLGQMVPAALLQASLESLALAEPSLTFLRGVRFEGMTPASGQTEVRLDDGTRLTARLVAACDGIDSRVRAVAGITTEERDYGKSVLAADVALDRPHQGIARQLFTPEGPFATLPLPGDRANLAWYMKSGAAETLAGLPRESIEAELNARFAAFAGRMQLIGAPYAYPLVLKIAREMAGPRTVLLGDAARRINPLAGQGLNLGFKDAAALIDVLTDARETGLDIGSPPVLARYQEWRRFDSAMTAFSLDAVDRLFSNDNALLKPLRAAALTAASRLGPLRRALARQASADQAHLPRLMR